MAFRKSDISSMLIDDACGFQEHLQVNIGIRIVAVPLDNDIKRKVFMSDIGYLWRLGKGFVHDSKYFPFSSDLTLQDALRYKFEFATKYLPRSIMELSSLETWPFRMHTTLTKPNAYSSGLVCEKMHSHEREIVSDFHSPFKPSNKKVAQTIRLIKYLSGENSWALWNMTFLMLR